MFGIFIVTFFLGMWVGFHIGHKDGREKEKEMAEFNRKYPNIEGGFHYRRHQ